MFEQIKKIWKSLTTPSQNTATPANKVSWLSRIKDWLKSRRAVWRRKATIEAQEAKVANDAFKKRIHGFVRKIVYLMIAVISMVIINMNDWWYETSVAAVIVVAILAGILIPLVMLALVSPLYVPFLVNKTTEDGKKSLHFFTYPEEGKVKLIVRGDTLVRMVMMFAGHHFAKKKTPSDPEYWKVVKAKTGELAEDPLLGIHPLLYWWAKYVFDTTGAVFTGIYPFQQVRQYPLERTIMNRDENKPDATVVVGKKNIDLTTIHDHSDHLRVREFLYPFRVVAADTKDKIPVEILGVIKAKVVNPHKAAFGTDRWDQQLVNLTTDALQKFAKTRTLDEVLTATEATVEDLNNVAKEIKTDELRYGIQIVGIDIIDTTAIVNDVDRSKIQAEALAIQVGKATVIDGKSRAEALSEINKANAAGGEHSLETMRAEAFVRAAGAAKEGTIILGGNNQTDSTQAAILAELKKLNSERRTT